MLPRNLDSLAVGGNWAACKACFAALPRLIRKAVPCAMKLPEGGFMRLGRYWASWGADLAEPAHRIAHCWPISHAGG